MEYLYRTGEISGLVSDYTFYLPIVTGERHELTVECSGAKDLFIPGEYAEILARHSTEDSPVLSEIEKDVSRTFPGNVFFGEFDQGSRVP